MTDTQSSVLFWSKLPSEFVSIFSLTPSKKTPVSRLRPAGKLNFSRTMTDTESGGSVMRLQGSPQSQTSGPEMLGQRWPPSTLLLSLQTEVWCLPLYGVFGNIFMNQTVLLS